MAACSSLPNFLQKEAGIQTAANIQAGKTNTQTLGQTKLVENTVSVRPNSRVETVRQESTETKISTEGVETFVFNEIPIWLILLFGLLCGFLIPSPGEIFRGIKNAFK